MADSNITKNALAVSMKKLMEKKPFSKISVGDICEGLRHEPEKLLLSFPGQI